MPNNSLADSPYKFLEYYDYTTDDQALFFGRERETQILLSDIIVRRLVVLFAKTGTGKTSLINAGVRPLLQKRGYATYFVRVAVDPIESARQVLDGAVKGPEGNSLSALLTAKAKEKPLVIFFDQFEEFFQPDVGRSKRREFISQVAELHRDKSSSVHIVFSMREDFLYGMDQFRKDIPTIFRNDSNLRLLGLNESQARDAITKPAAQRNVTITEDLVKQLIHDLSKNQETPSDEQSSVEFEEDIEIDPTQLQIVCDTLWRRKVGDPNWRAAEHKEISLDDYSASTNGTRPGNTAREILNQRLAECFEDIISEKELKLLEKLLPKLRTRTGTKYVRQVGALVQELAAEEDELRGLLARLVDWQLIRKSQREDSVELSHDYLVKSLNDLRRRVRAITPRRVLAEAISSFGTRGERMLPEDLARVTKNAGLLTLTPTETEFLFRASLANEIEMKVWFDRAQQSGTDVWDILEQKIQTKDVVQALYVLDLLAEMRTPHAYDLLRRALKQPRLASHVVHVLGQTRTVESVRLLETRLDSELSDEVEAALTRLASSHRDTEVAEAAKKALVAGERRKSGQADKSRTISADFHYYGDYRSPHKTGLMPPYPLLYERLNKGHVIPFLGYGASVYREPDSFWSPDSAILPTAYELTSHLAELSNFPMENEPRDLAKVAEYFQVVAGRRVLNRRLHEIFRREVPIAPIHRFLAELSAPMLIVTTNYDDLIESAFKEVNREYDVVIHTTDRLMSEAVLWWPHGATEPENIHPNRLDLDLNSRTVIYKMNGSVDRFDQNRDQYVVTEDDHIEFLTRLSKNRAVPPVFAESFQTRPFLFLGYGLRDWHVRVVLNRLSQEFRRHRGLKSWSIQMRPSPLEVRLWQAGEVNIFDMPLDQFVSEITTRPFE